MRETQESTRTWVISPEEASNYNAIYENARKSGLLDNQTECYPTRPADIVGAAIQALETQKNIGSIKRRFDQGMRETQESTRTWVISPEQASNYNDLYENARKSSLLN